MATSKNYKTDDGNTWVIGGKLVLESDAVIEGQNLVFDKKIENQPQSKAEDVETLKKDFNALLNKLRTAGLMK